MESHDWVYELGLALLVVSVIADWGFGEFWRLLEISLHVVGCIFASYVIICRYVGEGRRRSENMDCNRRFDAFLFSLRSGFASYR